MVFGLPLGCFGLFAPCLYLGWCVFWCFVGLLVVCLLDVVGWFWFGVYRLLHLLCFGCCVCLCASGLACILLVVMIDFVVMDAVVVLLLI